MFSKMRSAFANAVSGLDNSQPEVGLNNAANTAPKFPYSRPHFLNLNLAEEVPLSADHRVRPIIVPRERDALPWGAGYAECVNSGKSVKNEDQATMYQFTVTRAPNDDGYDNINEQRNRIGVTYFGMFDGHAGFGAAVCAARQLHYIVEEKILDVLPNIWADLDSEDMNSPKRICKETLVIGALEQAFLEMDQLIAEDRNKYLAAGGCTALVVLIMLGRVYIANAGDSRSVQCSRARSVQLSFDFTPESERSRIKQLAEQKPELLCGEYTAREYNQEPKFLDLGKQIFFKDPLMHGWAAKTLTKEDLKMPVVTGEGKRSRVMNTIGVSRGFGDHDLRAINSKILIKPFLSAYPEVSILDLEQMCPTDDDVLIMATDGLWDVTTNQKAAEIIDRILTTFPDEKHKYISSAQALVAHARGKPVGESSWRTSEGRPATGDDVSVLVIPLRPAKEEHTIEFNINPRTYLTNANEETYEKTVPNEMIADD